MPQAQAAQEQQNPIFPQGANDPLVFEGFEGINTAGS